MEAVEEAADEIMLVSAGSKLTEVFIHEFVR